MKVVLVAFFSAVVLVAPSKANIVTNAGFETGDFTGWTLDVLNAGDSPFVFVDDFVPHSGTWAALFGNFNDFALLSQVLATTAGATYDLSFWILNEGDPPNSFSVSWDGGVVESRTDEPQYPIGVYQQFTVSGLTASSASTTLEFSFIHEPSFWDLDDVSVDLVEEPPPGETPEPGTLGLMCLGAIGLGIARRRLQH